MKYLLCLLLAASLLSAPLCAHTQIRITGVVKDADGRPLGGATVSFVRISDEHPLKLALTGDSGRFELELPKETAGLLLINSLGYAAYRSERTVLRQDTAWPPVQLGLAEAKKMKDVVVTARTPLVEKKIDRLVVNVDALISNSGLNALQVLENAPGVQVDNDGTISLRGKSGVLVFVDDKPTYMSGAELAAYLKAMPSGLLDKIEIMSNPPAKYDAAGDAGIINIRTKKIRRSGFNGSASVAYGRGRYGRTNDAFNFNYRNAGVNAFGYLGYSSENTLYKLSLDRQYYNQAGSLSSSLTEQVADKRSTDNYAAKLGIDVKAGARSTIGLLFNGFVRPSKKEINSLTQVYTAAMKPDFSVVSDNTQKEQFGNGAFNVNYRRQFDSLHGELSADLDYVQYKSRRDQHFLNDVYQPDNQLSGTDNLTGRLPLNVNIYSAKADYTRPLKGGGRLDGGIKTSLVKTTNTAAYFTNQNGIVQADYEKTNDFRYSEKINAAYITTNRVVGRLEIQAGLRLENTEAEGHQLGNVMRKDSAFKRNFTNLFPTGYLSYKLDSAGDHSLSLTYGRRINRPYYQDLNPFVFPLGKFTYRYGNPFLQPQLADNVELSYGYRSTLNFTLLYVGTSHAMSETVESKDSLFITRVSNIGRTRLMGATVDINLAPRKWWSVNVYAEGLRNAIKGEIAASKIDTAVFTSYLSMTNRFKLGKSWAGEISGIWLSKNISGQLATAATGYLNAGIRKRIFQNKGSVALNARDLLRSKVNKARINNLPLVSAGFRNRLDTQVITLSFTYNFGTGGSAKRRDTGSTNTEQERVKPE